MAKIPNGAASRGWAAIWPTVAGTVIGGLLLALVLWVVSRYVSDISPSWWWLLYAGFLFAAIVGLVAAHDAGSRVAQETLVRLEAVEVQVKSLRRFQVDQFEREHSDVLKALRAEGFTLTPEERVLGFRWEAPKGIRPGVVSSTGTFSLPVTRDELVTKFRSKGAELSGL